MAAGPALSVFLEDVSFSIGPYIIVNYMTSPSWVMSLLWIVMTFITYFFFKEPPHYQLPIKKPSPKVTQFKSVETTSRVNYVALPAQQLTKREKVAINNGEKEAVTYGTMAEEGRAGGHAENSSVNLSPLSGSSWLNRVRSNSSVCSEKRSIWKHLCESRLLYCLWLYFITKLVNEALCTSSPIVTVAMFKHWPESGVGILFGCLGLLLIPINVVIGRLSKAGVSDYTMLVYMLALSTVSLLFLVQFPFIWFGGYGPAQYVFGTTMLFSLQNALEAIAMSMLSKCMSKHLARGTLNSGLLSTEAGMGGRVVGDFLVTVSLL
jgi:hypothetical protein